LPGSCIRGICPSSRGSGGFGPPGNWDESACGTRRDRRPVGSALPACVKIDTSARRRRAERLNPCHRPETTLAYECAARLVDDDVGQECDKLGRCGTRGGLAEHFACLGVESRIQRERPMSVVLKAVPLALHRKLRAGETVSFRPHGHSMTGRIESGQLRTGWISPRSRF